MKGKPLYHAWWFWVALVFLIFGVWYIRGYLEWRGETAESDSQNILSQIYWQYLQKQSAELEEAYRNDPYGGETPEETLRLYVEALESKDYDLASKYFVPEEQKRENERTPEGIRTGGLEAFVRAYQNGEVKFTKYTSGDMYEVDVVPSGEDVGFYLRLKPNPFTHKWKITDF